jgi:DNA-binding NarL/FixJ family response regulator
VRRTGVLLAAMPQMLCDILTDVLSGQADMAVVGGLPDRNSLVAAALATRAEVIVIGLPDGDLPAECGELLDAQPHVRVFGVGANGREAFLYQTRTHRIPLGEVSPQGLVQAIRTAVSTSTGEWGPVEPE